VKDAIRQRCPSVRWKDSYVTMNGYDVVDVVEAPDAAEVEKAAMIIRSMAHATTHTTQATPWKSFLQTMAS
ncbi:MAG: GYD domain-containing protein, partial [Gammaproteobacteria bacterium]|nr:GYD domain-containing protein [Gammaproteobacteria bacterium]NIR60619.1 GYD domain-containing protein [Gammaproteobacteria bacterium]